MHYIQCAHLCTCVYIYVSVVCCPMQCRSNPIVSNCVDGVSCPSVLLQAAKFNYKLQVAGYILGMVRMYYHMTCVLHATDPYLVCVCERLSLPPSTAYKTDYNWFSTFPSLPLLAYFPLIRWVYISNHMLKVCQCMLYIPYQRCMNCTRTINPKQSNVLCKPFTSFNRPNSQ